MKVLHLIELDLSEEYVLNLKYPQQFILATINSRFKWTSSISSKLYQFIYCFLPFQEAIKYYKETAIERKLLQMANVYMAEADFDDNDEWFHDGIDDKPIIEDTNIEVREE